jgi:N-acetylglucosamine-6-phosphate deacetylase
VLAAADAGATIVTHLYNGQRPLHHRDPGVVGAALSDPRFTLGLIVDLVHVAPTAVRVAFAAAAGRVALVTDATAALGMPPGRYELGGEEVTIEEGRPPVRDDGTLAGASLRLDAAVANTVACGIDLEVALDAATRAPADALGRADLGRIAPDARADLVWLDDDLRARATWVGGRLVAGREAAGLPQLG